MYQVVIFFIVILSTTIGLTVSSIVRRNKFSYSMLLIMTKSDVLSMLKSKSSRIKTGKTLEKLDNKQIFNLYKQNEYLVSKIITNKLKLSEDINNKIFDKGIWWQISLRIIYEIYPISEIETILPEGTLVKIKDYDNSSYIGKTGSVLHTFPNGNISFFKKNTIGNVKLNNGTILFNVPYKSVEVINYTPSNEYPDLKIPSTTPSNNDYYPSPSNAPDSIYPNYI